MIPKLEGEIPELQKRLVDEEKVLEEIIKISKGNFPFSECFDKPMLSCLVMQQPQT